LSRNPFTAVINGVFSTPRVDVKMCGWFGAHDSRAFLITS